MKYSLALPLATASCVLAFLRLAGMTHPIYQAAAHLFVGGLVGARLASGRYYLNLEGEHPSGAASLGFRKTHRSVLTWLAVLLSALELACLLFLPR